MTKQEFLATSLLNNLKICWVNNNEIVLLEPRTIRFMLDNIEQCKPIIRSLDDLTKPIVQAGYNNGEPFVPMIELAKMALDNPKSKWKIVDGMAVDDNTNCFLFDETTFDFNLVSTKLGMVGPIANQLKLFQQLIHWHFWPDMPEGEEVVYVTDEFNPYK